MTLPDGTLEPPGCKPRGVTIFDLHGKVAIVTGGNGGIGLGLARGLAASGASVVIAARDRAKSSAGLAELAAMGCEAAAIEVDVTSEGSTTALIDATEARFGHLDILVNGAGINIRHQPEDFTLEEWSRVLETNLTGAFLCSRAAYPAMKRASGGKIINIGSMMSLFGAPYAAAYAASKGGVLQLTKSLAAAWAKDGIQVNAILPGWIDTDMTRRAREQVPGLHDSVVARTPAGRWGSPSDLVGVCIFLASPASDFITGAGIAADGGYSAVS